MNAKEKELQEFLSKVIHQRDISLIILENKDDFKSLKNFLESNVFIKKFSAVKLVDKLEQINEERKYYFWLDEAFDKDVYNLLSQYSTGQVQIFDADKMDYFIWNPDYQKTTVIFVVSREKLQELEKQGYSIRSKVGLTFIY